MMKLKQDYITDELKRQKALQLLQLWLDELEEVTESKIKSKLDMNDETNEN